MKCNLLYRRHGLDGVHERFEPRQALSSFSSGVLPTHLHGGCLTPGCNDTLQTVSLSELLYDVAVVSPLPGDGLSDSDYTPVGPKLALRCLLS